MRKLRCSEFSVKKRISKDFSRFEKRCDMKDLLNTLNTSLDFQNVALLSLRKTSWLFQVLINR